MAKRFIDTNLFSDEWFFELDKDSKLAWIYLITNCNHAGIYEKPIKIAQFETGIDDFAKCIDILKERLIFIERNKYFIPNFIKYQYSNGLSQGVSTHKSIISILNKYSIPYNTFQDMGVRDNITNKLKNDVLQRDGKKCIYCEKELTNFEITYDHVVPVKLGGKAKIDNVVTSCRSCNSSKGDKPLDKWVHNNNLGVEVINRVTERLSITLSESVSDTLKDKDKDKDTDKDKDKDTDTESKKVKHIYGEYKHVRLSDEEYEKLKERFSDLDRRIKNLDEYIQQHGKNYKDHYLTIIKWAEKDKPAVKSSDDIVKRTLADIEYIKSLENPK